MYFNFGFGLCKRSGSVMLKMQSDENGGVEEAVLDIISLKSKFAWRDVVEQTEKLEMKSQDK